jgi:hypothetical protein
MAGLAKGGASVQQTEGDLFGYGDSDLQCRNSKKGR